MVTGKGGTKLYLDGLLRGTNKYSGSFSAMGNDEHNYFGRNNWRLLFPLIEDLQGQMDEVRVWRTARSSEQIRENMFKKLTGNEPDLVGLWNFDDPANPGRDFSPGAHHGKLFGQAAAVKEATPTALLNGKVTDAAGTPLAGARIEVRQQGGEITKATTDATGGYVVMVFEHCDLFVTTGKLSAYRLGFHPSGDAMQKLDWTLAPVTAAATQYPAGTVVTRVLTDEFGNFDFANVQPGRYQLRAQVLHEQAWYQAGGILLAEGG